MGSCQRKKSFKMHPCLPFSFTDEKFYQNGEKKFVVFFLGGGGGWGGEVKH